MAALRETPRDWYLTSTKQIVRDSGNGDWVCPYLALRGGSGVVGMDLARTIWLAADNAKDHDPTLRAELLEACGLAEVVQ